jgi:predicted DNA binding protein
VLVVATDRADAFSEPERAEFELLGEMVGFVLSAVATRKLLIADSVLDLDFEVAAGDDVFVDLSERFDCVCTVEESVPLRGRRLLQYTRVDGTSPERAAAFAAERDDVEVRRILDEHDETGLLELVVSASPVTDLVDLGATVESVVAEGGTGRLVVEAPSDVDVRTLADVLRTRYEHVELVSKHERPRHVEMAAHFVDDFDEWLTDRQWTAIRTAYAAGYYDWPRKSTAEEVADSLDITSATLHQHLRKAEEKLLRAYLTGRSGP